MINSLFDPNLKRLEIWVLVDNVGIPLFVHFLSPVLNLSTFCPVLVPIMSHFCLCPVFDYFLFPKFPVFVLVYFTCPIFVILLPSFLIPIQAKISRQKQVKNWTHYFLDLPPGHPAVGQKLDKNWIISWLS